ncbi:MAG TPA: hypothetical protein VFA48_12120, partial [Gammaproteobacteria bacterium]|nr:hypothetical protein [Gammaproteobacteria bacterium]
DVHLRMLGHPVYEFTKLWYRAVKDLRIEEPVAGERCEVVAANIEINPVRPPGVGVMQYERDTIRGDLHIELDMSDAQPACAFEGRKRIFQEVRGVATVCHQDGFCGRHIKGR